MRIVPRRAGVRAVMALALLALPTAPVAAADPGATWTGQVPVGPIQRHTCAGALAGRPLAAACTCTR